MGIFHWLEIAIIVKILKIIKTTHLEMHVYLSILLRYLSLLCMQIDNSINQRFLRCLIILQCIKVWHLGQETNGSWLYKHVLVLSFKVILYLLNQRLNLNVGLVTKTDHKDLVDSVFLQLAIKRELIQSTKLSNNFLAKSFKMLWKTC